MDLGKLSHLSSVMILMVHYPCYVTETPQLDMKVARYYFLPGKRMTVTTTPCANVIVSQNDHVC
jgi:hypothetical protein